MEGVGEGVVELASQGNCRIDGFRIVVVQLAENAEAGFREHLLDAAAVVVAEREPCLVG